MKMLGHEHPADQQEMPFLPHFLKALDETATESVGDEECRATIGAAGDELQLTGIVDALVERHGPGGILATIVEGKNEGRGIWVNADTKGVSAPAGGIDLASPGHHHPTLESVFMRFRGPKALNDAPSRRLRRVAHCHIIPRSGAPPP